MAITVTNTPADPGSISGVSSTPQGLGSLSQPPVPSVSSSSNINQVSGTPLTDLVTPTAPASTPTAPTPTPQITPGSFADGSGYDSSGNAVQANTDAIDSQLNNAQSDSLSQLTSTPTSQDTAASQAWDLINKSLDGQKTNADNTSSVNQDISNLPQTILANYNTAAGQTGISDAQSQVTQAMKDYNDAQLEQKSNPINIQNQYSGGGTVAFGSALNTQQGLGLSIKTLAASLNLQVAQQNLNNKTDMFKELDSNLNSGSQFAIQKKLDTIAQQTGVDSNDLSAGVSLLNQVRQENQNNESQTRQWVQLFATQFPSFYQNLSSQDQQALAAGQITPSIVAKMGETATTAGSKLGISQQNANSKSALDVTNEMASLTKTYQENGGDVNSPAFAATMNQMMQQFNTLSAGSSPDGGQTAGPGTIASSTGASYDISSYNGNPTYSSSVQGILSNINSSVDTSTPTSIDGYIKSLAPDSPVTGTMITQAAQANGVDPAAMMALMQKESSLGSSAVAKLDNNYGGMTWSQSYQDSHPGTTKGTPRPASEGGYYVKYATPQAGVNAQAQWLANHSGSATGGLYGNNSGQSSPFAVDVKNTSPQDNGARYLDVTAYDKSSPQYQAALSYANKNGIFPVTDATELKSLQGINQARGLLSKMTSLATSAGTFSNAMNPFGMIGQSVKQLEKSPGSSGSNQRQWSQYGAQLQQLAKTITGTSRVSNSLLESLNVPSTTKSSPTDAQNFLDNLTSALNDAETSIVGKAAPKNTPSTANGLYLQNKFGGVPVGSSLQGGQ